jgi:preprotein translocase subunit SecG
MFITIFFASAQAFNSVLPERGLFHWLFSFFFLWTLWNNQFSSFDARRLLRSLTILFGTAFVLKHILLSNLYSPEGGWLKRLAGTLLQGITLDAPAFAPITGYIAFFTLALYIVGLILIHSRRNATNGSTFVARRAGM